MRFNLILKTELDDFVVNLSFVVFTKEYGRAEFYGL